MIDQLAIPTTLDAIVGDARRMLATHDQFAVRDRLTANLTTALQPRGHVAEHGVLLLAEAIMRLALTH